jgi:acetylornithine deacetylase/succinyl-diaminopimelate desuccinylase-like protein
VPFQIKVKGKAAHGARPWLGVNAIRQSHQVLTALDALEFGSYDVPGFGMVQGSLNLGVIRGGRAYNIVPDECLMWYDRRIVPGETMTSTLEQVRKVLDGLRETDPPVEAELFVARPDWDWEPIERRGLLPAVTPEGAAISKMVAQEHQDVIGSPVDVYFTDGYNEMDFLINDLGIPTVQYGPGDNALCHTDEERLSIKELVDATHVYMGLALAAAT